MKKYKDMDDYEKIKMYQWKRLKNDNEEIDYKPSNKVMNSPEIMIEYLEHKLQQEQDSNISHYKLITYQILRVITDNNMLISQSDKTTKIAKDLIKIITDLELI